MKQWIIPITIEVRRTEMSSDESNRAVSGIDNRHECCEGSECEHAKGKGKGRKTRVNVVHSPARPSKKCDGRALGDTLSKVELRLVGGS